MLSDHSRVGDGDPVRPQSESRSTDPHHVLAPGVEFCRGGAFGGGDCAGATGTVQPNTPPGSTTVIITKSNMSHSEIAVCVRGSTPGGCPAGC